MKFADLAKNQKATEELSQDIKKMTTTLNRITKERNQYRTKMKFLGKFLAKEFDKYGQDPVEAAISLIKEQRANLESLHTKVSYSERDRYTKVH